jgi:hypothetical protein
MQHYCQLTESEFYSKVHQEYLTFKTSLYYMQSFHTVKYHTIKSFIYCTVTSYLYNSTLLYYFCVKTFVLRLCCKNKPHNLYLHYNYDVTYIALFKFLL